MKLLAFETATEACSVALWIDGEVRERHEIAPRRHAELALPWADELLAEAGIAKSQLDAIAVGRGPGAFTGVRLAIALAQGVALALDRPVVPVSTLAVLALGAYASDTPEPLHVLAAIDARMGEIYAGLYEVGGGRVLATGDERIVSPDRLVLPESQAPWIGRGTGFGASDGVLKRRVEGVFASVDAAALPRASDLACLAVRAYQHGESMGAESVEPTYLRNEVALTLAQQQALKQG